MMGLWCGYGYGNVFNGWWMLGFGLLRLILVVGAIIFIVKLVKNNDRQYTTNKALEILKDRFVNGEIDEEEYKKKLKIIK